MIEGISFSLQGVLVLTIAMGSIQSTDLSHTERMSVRIRKSVKPLLSSYSVLNLRLYRINIV